MELSNCPCCNGEVRWCGDDPEDKHDCHQITCLVCGLQFDLETDDLMTADTLEDARIIMAKTYNTRTLSRRPTFGVHTKQ